MTKKAVWVNLISTLSTSLDTRINPHDIDTIAVSRLLEEQGFTVWLQDAYVTKSKRSSWPNVISRNKLKYFDADIAILIAPHPSIFDYMRSKYLGLGSSKGYFPSSREFDFKDTCEWLDSFEGEIYIFSADPRDNFLSILTGTLEIDGRLKHDKCYNILLDVFNKAKLIVPDKNLVPSMSNRCIECDYWKIIDIPVYENIEPHIYDTVYTGVKTQTKYRKNIISTWLDTENSYTAGDLKIAKVESLTNHKKCSLISSITYTRDSKTTLICGEEGHTWLTPRAMTALCSGSIASIHPDFNGMDIMNELDNQINDRVSLFDDSLLKNEVYQKQLNIFNKFRNEHRPLELT